MISELSCAFRCALFGNNRLQVKHAGFGYFFLLLLIACEPINKKVELEDEKAAPPSQNGLQKPIKFYEWKYTAWARGTCASQTSRNQRREAFCLNESGVQVADSNCVDVPKEVLQRQIADASCGPAPTYSWQYTSWLSTICANTTQRTQTRTASCVSSTGATVANSSCMGIAQGALTQLINDSACASAETYAWQYTSWLSTTCANTTQRTQTRTASCVSSTGATVANSSCTGIAQGALTQLINDSTCAPAETYSWRYSNWVNDTCFDSTTRNQSRQATCLSSSGAIVANSNCSLGSQDQLTRKVADNSCGTFDLSQIKIAGSNDRAQLLQRDLQDLQNFSESAATSVPWFDKIFGGVNATSVIRYLAERVGLIIADHSNLTFTPSSQAFDADSFLRDYPLTIAFMRPFWRANAPEWSGRQTFIDYNNNESRFIVTADSRPGVIYIGGGYSATGQFDTGATFTVPASYRQSILVHEARHCDCTGGYSLSQLSQTCNHPHIACPAGHEYAGLFACEDRAWGAYSADLIFLKVSHAKAMVDQSTLDRRIEASVLEQQILDRASRIIPNSTTGFSYEEMIKGTFGDPDMSSQGFVNE